jgi:hypothetical protein
MGGLQVAISGLLEELANIDQSFTAMQAGQAIAEGIAHDLLCPVNKLSVAAPRSH